MRVLIICVSYTDRSQNCVSTSSERQFSPAKGERIVVVVCSVVANCRRKVLRLFGQRYKPLVFSERELTFTHVHVRYMLSPVRLSVVCLSVCLSVTFVRPT